MRRRLLSPRYLIRPAVFLVLGVAGALGVACVLASTVDPWLGVPRSASVFDGEAEWTVTAWSRRGVHCVVSERQVVLGAWSPRQTVGAPDTPQAGDIQTAWAQSAQDAPGEWLEMTYAAAVVPEAVHVYETYNPGALVAVSVFKEDGTEVKVWEGRDPTPPGTKGIGVSRIPLGVDFPVRRVKLYLDSVSIPSWNEIDAVGLVERGGKSMHWAVRAKASSSYSGGLRTGPTAPVTALLPQWSGLREPAPGFAMGATFREARAAAAFGWPMAVVYGQSDLPKTSAPPPPAPSAGLEVLGDTMSTGAMPMTSGTIAAPAPPGPYGRSGMPSGVPPGMAPAAPPGVAPPEATRSGRVRVLSGGTSVGPRPTRLTAQKFTLVSPPSPTPTPAGTWSVPRPRRVLWTGLAVNGVLYAVVLGVLYSLLVFPKRFVREVNRVKAGRCITCGYDLGYDFVRGCPECGWRREACASPAPPVLPPATAAEENAGDDWHDSNGEAVPARQPRRSPQEVAT